VGLGRNCRTAACGARIPGTSSEKPRMVYCSALPKGRQESYSVAALIGMSSDEMTPFQTSNRSSRDDRHRSVKRTIAERVVDVLKERWPGAGDQMQIMDACTPLTYRDYTLTPAGAAYGIKKTVDSLRHSRFTAGTKIKAPLLAGQSIILPGVLGSLISGVHACAAVLGQEYAMGKIVKESR
jgi:all-trans-retinol 13,14-reductase